jgi:hypothetical protein
MEDITHRTLYIKKDEKEKEEKQEKKHFVLEVQDSKIVNKTNQGEKQNG